LNPSYATAHQWHALNLTAQGDLAAGLRELDAAHQLDPLSLVILTDRGEMLTYARRYPEAVDQLEQVLKLDPNFLLAHEMLTHCQSLAGNYTEAVAHGRRAAQLSHQSPWAEAVLGVAMARSGHRADAEAIVHRLKKAPEAKSRADFVAMVEVALGHTDEAFVWLDSAREARLGTLILLQVDASWDPLRSDPRFKKLLPQPLVRETSSSSIVSSRFLSLRRKAHSKMAA
jgi:serine/threonine-protein kinase